MIAALVLGLVIGVLLGLLGGGGSILAVPALLYGVGMPLSAAVPTSLIVVGTSSAAAVLPRIRTGQLQWRIAAVFGLAGAATAFGGAAVNRLLEPWVVMAGFSAVMVAAGLRMLARERPAGDGCTAPYGGIDWRRCIPRAVAAGAVVGFLTGLFGVGGGFLVIPALVLFLGLPMRTAIGTSLVIIVITSTAGFLAYLGEVELDYGLASAFAGTAVVGALVAGRFATRLPADRLRRWFAYLVFVVAVLVIVQLVIDPSAIAG